MKLLYAFPESLPMPHARGVQVANTLSTLLDAGLDVTLAYTPDNKLSSPLEEYGLYPSRPLKCLALSRHLPKPFGFLPIRSNNFYNRQLISWLDFSRSGENAPDVILTRHIKTAYALLRAKNHIPVVYEAHEVFARSAKQKYQQVFFKMETYVLEHASRVIAISGALANDLAVSYNPAVPIEILPSGVTLSNKSPVKEWNDCAKRIVYAGSLFGWKGVSDLISAAQWLPGHRIIIIGGSLEEIEMLRRELPNRGAEIEFTGRLSHEQVQKELSKACVAVLPNRAISVSAWTSPIKLFEYMGAGCAIVASDLPSIREIIGPDDAILVHPQSPKQLAEAIRYLTSNPHIAASMGMRLRSRAEDFTWERRASRLIGMLRQTIANGL